MKKLMNKFYKIEANGWALMSFGTLMLYGLISLIADCIEPFLNQIVEEGANEMKYEKPKCECGEKLVILEHTMHTTNRKIKKDGRLAKMNFGEVATELHAVELNCPSCCNSYEVEFDEGGRVYRGSH